MLKSKQEENLSYNFSGEFIPLVDSIIETFFYNVDIEMEFAQGGINFSGNGKRYGREEILQGLMRGELSIDNLFNLIGISPSFLFKKEKEFFREVVLYRLLDTFQELEYEEEKLEGENNYEIEKLFLQQKEIIRNLIGLEINNERKKYMQNLIGSTSSIENKTQDIVSELIH